MIKEPINLSISELSEINTNEIGILNVPDTELQSQINLLYVMLNTQQGEKVMDYEFGVPFTSQLFEQYHISSEQMFELNLSEIIKSKAKKYFPNFSLLTLESYFEGIANSESQIMIIKCLWSYLDKFKFNSISVVDANNKMGSLISPIEFVGENEDNESADVVTSKAINNIVNLLKQHILIN